MPTPPSWGATHAYLVPGLDASPAGLTRFAEACSLLADYAQQRMVRLCVEHVPGRALPTVAATRTWLEEIGHENLHLLVDLGHCLISREDPATVVQQAGPQLGFVHLDDNDGEQDCHWPLLTGKLTEDVLTGFLKALVASSYDGALTLELNPANADPVGALRQGKALIEKAVTW